MPDSKRLRILFFAMVSLLPGACSNVREAPVVERPAPVRTPAPVAVESATAAMTEEPVSGFPAGKPLVEEAKEQWVRLPDQDPATERAPSAQRPSDNPAVLALLDDADVHLSEDNSEGAANAIERTLRLEPKNPWLWHRLAALRLEQGNWRQAVALAGKSDSLAAGRPALRRANASLIARAKKYQKRLE